MSLALAVYGSANRCAGLEWEVKNNEGLGGDTAIGENFMRALVYTYI